METSLLPWECHGVLHVFSCPIVFVPVVLPLTLNDRHWPHFGSYIIWRWQQCSLQDNIQSPCPARRWSSNMRLSIYYILLALVISVTASPLASSGGLRIPIKKRSDLVARSFLPSPELLRLHNARVIS
jgi:hypothetical protein